MAIRKGYTIDGVDELIETEQMALAWDFLHNTEGIYIAEYEQEKIAKKLMERFTLVENTEIQKYTKRNIEDLSEFVSMDGISEEPTI